MVLADRAIAADPIQRQLHVDPGAGIEMLADHSQGLDALMSERKRVGAGRVPKTDRARCCAELTAPDLSVL
ncbi:hypothetical protein BJ6T_49470 [Bradyrhizobium japonicum USDA 6]|nr:hypothetical protein BJ6T_49470 [Bradyrhizobium japonicum USDA 6]